ncbi:MAG TPA: hypothetical protein PKN33_01550 [Phycisphaerae bacterium]|nr:hypothetical protein [Phycisphaerae bacterium]
MASGMRSFSIGLAAVFALVALFGSAQAAAEQVNVRTMQLRHYTTQSDEAYAKKDWKRAIQYREYVTKILPFDHNNYYNLACCYALDGQTDKAFEALDNSIRYGWCDAKHIKNDSDLESLRDDERFEAMLESVAKCNKETQFVYEPETSSKIDSVSLIVALCGDGGNPREFAPEWIPVADELGVPIVAPKGQGVTDRDGVYGWHKGTDANEIDVEGTVQRIDQVAKDRGVDLSNVVVVGFSQGGAAALEIITAHPKKYRGVVAIGAGEPIQLFRQWIANVAESNPRVYMIAGELDNNRPFNLAAVNPLQQAGLKFKYEIVPMVGHEMPENGTELLLRAIQFVAEDS